MSELYTDGNLTIDDIFREHKKEIYLSAIDSIIESIDDTEISDINVVKINTQHREYHIRLSKDNFIAVLKSCIDFFEELELYETCKVAYDLILKIETKITAS
jgi:hypothetical protein